MPRSTVADWSPVAGENTDVGGISIAEGSLARDTNDAMREMMAQVARNASEIRGMIPEPVDTIVDLRAYDRPDGQTTVQVLGGEVIGDGGGGFYYFDSDDGVSHDSAPGVIVGADGARWKIFRPTCARTLAEARTFAIPLAVGTVLDILGHTAPGDGGGFMGVVTAADDPRHPGGGRIAPLPPYSVRMWGALGDGSDQYAAVRAALDFCLAEDGATLHFPKGTYMARQRLIAPGDPVIGTTDLFDCRNLTLTGEGPGTILKTVTPGGGDVVNLFNCKDMHVRNLAITAELTGTDGSGSNGLSIIGGFDNLTFADIWLDGLPRVEKTNNGARYVDGGKGLTYQLGAPAGPVKMGTLRARGIHARDCAYGVDVAISDLTQADANAVSIDIEGTAEDCYVGFVNSNAASPGPLSPGMATGVRMRGTAIDCQRSVKIDRGHGIDVDIAVATGKTAAARRLAPDGAPWLSTDSVVDGLYAVYAKNSRIAVAGDAGECDYKARVGGTTPGASGRGGDTEDSTIYVDLGGTAALGDFGLVNIAGGVVRDTHLTLTLTTVSALNALPTLLFAPVYGNTLTAGPSTRLPRLTLTDPLSFASGDGKTVYTTLRREGFGVVAQQTGGSSAPLLVLGAMSNTGDIKFGARNDGGLILGGSSTGGTLGSLVKRHPVYDASGTFVGYVPIYS